MWFTGVMQLFNYCMKSPKAMHTSKVPKEVWIKLYDICKLKGDLF